MVMRRSLQFASPRATPQGPASRLPSSPGLGAFGLPASLVRATRQRENDYSGARTCHAWNQHSSAASAIAFSVQGVLY